MSHPHRLVTHFSKSTRFKIAFHSRLSPFMKSNHRSLIPPIFLQTGTDRFCQLNLSSIQKKLT